MLPAPLISNIVIVKDLVFMLPYALVKGREGFEGCCGAGLCDTTAVLNSSMVSATTNNSESDRFSWLSSTCMASEVFTCGERMGGDSERLTSAVESRVSSACGRLEATEEVVFLERK